MHVLLTMHDVMPDTLHKVQAIIELVPVQHRQSMLLLVVPGKHWSTAQLKQLEDWQKQGFVLAGHGWHHEVRAYNGLYHKLHARLISRNVGEHLPLSEMEILDLMQRCHDWFPAHGLQAPDYYVPPAWALGFADIKKVRQLPFRYLEVMGGIHDLEKEQFRSLPLCGFEADTSLRAGFLHLWNPLQGLLASAKRPLRLSFHPFDPELKMHKQLQRFLQKITQARDYHSLFSEGATT